MRKSTLALALLLSTLAFAAAPGFAQGTPDWITPSRENVCDDDSGAAYGLCTAYCEAMDCDFEGGPHASPTGCERVQARYQQITGNVPACEASACPCVGGMSGFAASVASDEISHCALNEVSDEDGNFSLVTQIFLWNGDSAAVAAGGDNVCAFLPGNDGPSQSLGITSEEADACSALLEEMANALDVICE